ncbi:MAG: sigma-54-dependent Fis family transcriptional regulator [Bacteroidales bacterium]|nr:sigma-54-dependent Fis family transcriptional regulator [Bacteroidales bacterium]
MELQSLKNRFDLIGDDPQFNRALEVAEMVASTDMTVLVSGESGVGKESIPQIIHNSSPRKHGKYIAVNCGAIPEGTMESELFGHIKGSFTGANENRKGYFEVADGGTIFLDEVGELSAESQKRLLRVLESGEFYKVGSSTVQKTDVRVIAATNVNLQEAIRQKKFREDLFYRLNQIPVFLPPLRERKGDIYLLFRKFATDCADRYQMPPVSLTRDAQAMLISYRWPGNIRQLKNVVEQITILEPERLIDSSMLKKYLPFQDEDLHPVLPGFSSPGGSFIDDKDMILKMIYALKQEVESIKQSISMGALPQPSQNIQVSANQADGKVIDVTPQSDDFHSDHSLGKDNLSISSLYEERIKEVLMKYPRNRKAAAEELGISERTLYRKIKDYGINVKKKRI